MSSVAVLSVGSLPLCLPLVSLSSQSWPWFLVSSGQGSLRGHQWWSCVWGTNTVFRERWGEVPLLTLEKWRLKGRSYWCLQLPAGRAWRDTLGGALWYDRRLRTRGGQGEALNREQEKRFSQWEWPTTWTRAKRHCDISTLGDVLSMYNVTLSSQIRLQRM